MKYSHRSNYRKTCPHDPETRAQLGQRLHYARCKLGWSVEDAGKYFQVTDRTWHNWENGSHRIPYAVYKLARVLARLELPGEAWAGWRIEGDLLITPEGRQITPKDGSWWSLLIRQARCCRSAMAEMTRPRRLRKETGNAANVPATSGAAAGDGSDAAGLVPYKTSLETTGLEPEIRRQNDVIIESWPILYDFQTPLTPLHAPRPTTLVSASTLSFALPWTPTCEARIDLLRADQSRSREHLSHLKQVSKVQSQNPKSSPAPKNKPSTSKKSSNEKPCLVSARPSAAKASAPRTGGQS
jgi:transcriptional regulator with XRE-family HTH domain